MIQSRRQLPEPTRRGLALLLLAIAIFYFYGLGAIPLVGPDEPRYAEVAREMLVRRDLITPTLGGHVWFEKPALLYWLMMAGYRLFGVTEFGARFGSAVCGLLAAVFILWVGSRVGKAEALQESGRVAEPAESENDCGWWSALVFLSSAGTVVFSRAASFDIVVTMTLTGALACFFLWHISSDDPTAVTWGSKLLLPGFYSFVGLSLLAKGLIGIVIPFAVIAFFFTLRREWPGRKLLTSLVWGLPLTAAVTAVWYGPMIRRHGWQFIDQFIIQHHFARFLTNKYHHPQPFYFYIPVLALLALPWTIFLVSALLEATRWQWRGSSRRDRMRVFAFAWVVIPVVLFSISESKLPAYALPVLPGVALLTGEWLTGFLRFEKGRATLRLTGLLAIVVAVGGSFYAVWQAGVPAHCAAIAGIPAIIAGTLVLARPQLGKVFLLLLMATVTLGEFAIALKCGAPVIAQRESVRDLIEAANARGYASLPVVQLYTIERTAEFYAAGRLTYASNGEPVMLEGLPRVVDAAHGHGGMILVLVPVKHAWKLSQSRSIAVENIGASERTVLALVREVNNPVPAP